MITLTYLGLDQFVVGHLSREITPLLASLYECSEDEIDFVAPNNIVFHNGVEQTSWNTLVRVHAPLKVKVLEDQAAKIIMDTTVGPTINVAVEFYYYSQDNRYEKINPDYPRFITDENLVNTEPDYCEDDDDDCCDHDHHHELHEGEESDEIYTGDIFKDFNKQ